ncbi:MAG: hypothetical protein AAFX90_19615 [Pseudomonadota bacterium]
MKILRRNNGRFCMEHNGCEAPYLVVSYVSGTFSVYDDDDDCLENPIVYNESKDACERRALDHMTRLQLVEDQADET